jgi:hypothetical protein
MTFFRLGAINMFDWIIWLKMTKALDTSLRLKPFKLHLLELRNTQLHFDGYYEAMLLYGLHSLSSIL